MTKKKMALSTSMAIMASLAMVVSASADVGDAKTNKDHQATFEIEGGDLTLEISDVLSFGTVKLDQVRQTVQTGFADKFTIIDARGTGEGWKLNVSSTAFVEKEPVGGFAVGTSAAVIPTGSLSLAPLKTIERVGLGTGTLPTSKNLTKTLIDGGAVAVAGAAIDAGMGEFALTFEADGLDMVIDASTARIDTINYPSTVTPYEATITWDLVSAP